MPEKKLMFEALDGIQTGAPDSLSKAAQHAQADMPSRVVHGAELGYAHELPRKLAVFVSYLILSTSARSAPTSRSRGSRTSATSAWSILSCSDTTHSVDGTAALPSYKTKGSDARESRRC